MDRPSLQFRVARLVYVSQLKKGVPVRNIWREVEEGKEAGNAEARGREESMANRGLDAETGSALRRAGERREKGGRKA